MSDDTRDQGIISQTVGREDLQGKIGVRFLEIQLLDPDIAAAHVVAFTLGEPCQWVKA